MATTNVRIFFADNLQRIRKEKGITYEELAESVGVSAVAIRQYEKALKLPPIDKIFELANCLQVSVNSLIGENDFSGNVPNVEKIVEEKIFEYRLQSATEFLQSAKCKLLKNPPRQNKWHIVIPATIKTKDSNGTVKITDATFSADVADDSTLVKLVEAAIARAANGNLTLVDALAESWNSVAFWE